MLEAIMGVMGLERKRCSPMPSQNGATRVDAICYFVAVRN
jgi:hypothetical protein